MSHYGATPTAIADAILTSLSVLLYTNGGVGGGGSGCAKTIKRLAGDATDAEAIDQQITRGLPAILVGSNGGTFESASTDGQTYYQRMRFSLICAAGRYSSQRARTVGAEVLSVVADPGVDDLLDWSTYYAIRAARALGGVTRIKPIDHKWIRIEPQKYLAIAEIEATRLVDVYDDAIATELEALGIVHDPLDLGQLFDLDNVTPNSSLPDTIDGGVYDL
jgi:hypothetical protein